MTRHRPKIAPCIAVLATAGTIALLVAGCNRTPRSAGSAPDITASNPRIVDGFASPESAVTAGARHFVSNLGGKVEPTRKDGDGYISELDAQGTVVRQRAFPRPGDAPLNAPKGMAVIGDRLYVADIDRLVGYDLGSHKQVFEAVVSGGPAKFFNDLAAENDTALLVTDTLRHALYRYDFGNKTFALVAGNMPGANGVVVDHARRLAYVAALGANFEGGDLYSIALDAKAAQAQRIGSAHGVFDGIALVDGQLLLSDWRSVAKPVPGTMTLHALDGALVATVATPELHGPADFDYDVAQRLLWIPDMLNNRLVIQPLPR